MMERPQSKVSIVASLIARPTQDGVKSIPPTSALDAICSVSLAKTASFTGKLVARRHAITATHLIQSIMFFFLWCLLLNELGNIHSA